MTEPTARYRLICAKHGLITDTMDGSHADDDGSDCIGVEPCCLVHEEALDYDAARAMFVCLVPGCDFKLHDSYEYGTPE